VLPAAARMRRSEEFTTTVSRGVRAGGPLLVTHLRRGPGHGVRVGFVVGRGVGPAIVRNRVRRRLRHLVSARLGTLPAGAAVVVRAHPGAAVLTSAELASDVDTAFARALGRQIPSNQVRA